MTSIKEFTNEYKNELMREMIQVLSTHKQNPLFVIIQIGDDPTGNENIAGIKDDCSNIGIICTVEKFDIEKITLSKILSRIHELNNSDEIHGIMVQLPLPSKFSDDTKKIINSIYDEKDVCGLKRTSRYTSCTSTGIINWLCSNGNSLHDKFVTIVSTNDIPFNISKSLTSEMITRGATVAYCNTRSTPVSTIKHLIDMSDIFVSEIDKSWFFTDEYNFSRVSIVIDVGMGYCPSLGKIIGNISPRIAKNHPMTYVTPVPNGVNLLSRVFLMKNIIDAFTFQKIPRLLRE